VDLDHWYWGYVYSSSSTEAMSVTTQLDHIADPAPDTIVRGLLRSFSGEPEHHSLIYLNGNLIDDAIWPDGTEYAFVSDPFPHTFLVEGENEILLELPLDGGITKSVAFINWYEIDYYDTYTADNDQLRFTAMITGPVKFNIGGFSSDSIFTYDITNPLSPTRIMNTHIDAGGTYTLTFERSYSEGDQFLALTDANYLSAANIIQDEPSNLRDTANGADYIVISHQDFITATQPLVDHRTSQGYRTMMVELGEVFDEFSGGVYTPVAIHDFLEYAYNNWQPPAPMYVVLAGDSTYDYKDNFAFGDQVFVPTYLAEIDPWIGETAADNRYVTIVGEDIFPDMHLGRLPANTEAEMTIMVDKILGYDQKSPITICRHPMFHTRCTMA
jgi:hypothetical protein